MKPKVLVTIAIAVVAIMVFGAVGSTTYSWFSDSDDTDINLKTAKFDITQFVTPRSDDCRIENDNIIKDTGFAPGDILKVNYSAKYYSDIPTVYRTYAEYTGDDSLVEYITVNGEEFISKKAVIIEWTFLESTGGVETIISDLPIDGISVEFSGEYNGSMHEALDCSVRIVTEIYQEAYYYNSVDPNVVARVDGNYYNSIYEAHIDGNTESGDTIYVLKNSTYDLKEKTITFESKDVTIKSVDGSLKEFNLLNCKYQKAIEIKSEVTFRNIAFDFTFNVGNWKNVGILAYDGALNIDSCKFTGTDLAVAIQVGESTPFSCKNTEFGQVDSNLDSFSDLTAAALYMRGTGAYTIDGCTFSGFKNSITFELNNGNSSAVKITNNVFSLDARIPSLGVPPDHTDRTTGIVIYTTNAPSNLTIAGNVFKTTMEDHAAVFATAPYNINEYNMRDDNDLGGGVTDMKFMENFRLYLLDSENGNEFIGDLVYCFHVEDVDDGKWQHLQITTSVDEFIESLPKESS